VKIAELMTKNARTCRADQSLNDAAQIMWERDCGCVPVLGDDASQRVIGVITDRDIAIAAYCQGRTLKDISIRSAMSKQVCCCSPDTDARTAEQMMAKAQVRRLVVLDDGGRLLGVLSIADLAQEAAHPRHGGAGLRNDEVGATLASISQPHDGGHQPSA
jgi:CBS domain-containing protein